MTDTEMISKTKQTRAWSKRLLRSCGGCALLLVLGVVTLTGMYFYANRSPDLLIPTPTLPADNGYDDFVRAGKLAKSMSHPSPYSMGGAPAQTMTYQNFKACAKDAIPVEAAVRQGLGKTCLCPPVRSYKSVSFKDFALFRETARTLLGKARYEEMSGHPGQAIETLLDGYAMGATLPRGGTIIALLVCIACEAIVSRPIEDILPLLNEQELAHVAQRLDTIEARHVPFADILDEEGNTTAAELLEMFHDPKNQGLGGLDNLSKMYSGDLNGNITWKERLMAASYLFKNKNAVALQHQKYYRDLAAEARLPYSMTSAVKVGDDPMLVLEAGIVPSVRSKYIGMKTVAILLRTETALERYRHAHHRYPADLAALVPAYLKTIPIDVCSGKANTPLRYSLSKNTTQAGQSYLLYSVGPDMHDDGGIPQKYVGDTSPGDLVAGRLWPKRNPIAIPAKK